VEQNLINPIRTATSVALIVFGLAFMLLAYGYGLGTPINFGPGLFPFLFGGLLVVTIAVDFVHVHSDKTPDTVTGIELRRLLCVCISLLSFGVLLGSVGFVPAVFATTAVAMRAEPSVGWKTLFLYAVTLSTICYVVFLVILGIPVAAFG
jgi:putative tricarboxylic transport membrane protein